MSRSPAVRTGARSAAAVAVLLAAGAAVADVSIDVLSGDKAKGTVDPADESEVYRMHVPTGSRITVKAKGAGGFLPSLRLEDPMLQPRASGAESGASASISGFEANASGFWSAIVGARSGGTGGYSLSVKWTVPRSAEFDVATVDSAPATAVVYLAGGSKVSASTQSDDSVVAVIVGVTGPGMFESANDGDDEHDFTAPATGQYVYTVTRSAPGNSGLLLRIKPPKKSKRKIDVTARTIGGDGESFAVGAVLGPDGGQVVVPDLGLGGGLDDISGSGVSLPSGALGFPGVIVVGTAPQLDPNGDPQPVGPTVSFGPDGLRFTQGTQATITIPWDSALAGGSSDSVTIYTRDAKGKVTAVPRPYDFSTPGFVSIPTSHFSSYVATAVPPAAPALGIGEVISPLNGSDIADATGFGNAQRVLWYTTNDMRLSQIVSGVGGLSVESFAGGGASTADGTNRSQFAFGTALTSVFEFGGDVYVATATAVYKVDLATDQVFRVAGSQGTAGDAGDGGAATAATFTLIGDLFVDSAGTIYVTDLARNRIRAIDNAGAIDAFVGTGAAGDPVDGEPAAQSNLTQVSGITEGSQSGHFFVVEANRVDRVRSDTGNIQVWSGAPDDSTGCTTGQTGAGAARFTKLGSISADPDRGQLYVTDESCNAVYMVNEAFGEVRPVYGTPPTPGFSATGAQTGALDTPRSVVAVPSVGGVRSFHFLDVGNNRVRSLNFTSP